MRHSVISDSVRAIKQPKNITILTLALLLFPTFFLWMHHQKKANKVALIPNNLWTKIPFLAISLMVLLQWAVVQSMEVYFSLLSVYCTRANPYFPTKHIYSFQNVQHTSPSQASLRFLPGIAIGVALNVFTGLLVHRIRIDILVALVSILATTSPLLLALTDPKWSYWYTLFWSVLLSPVSVDGTPLRFPPVCII